MNYAELVTAVQNYSENSFSKEDIDTFIKQTEQRIYHTVQLPSLRRNVTGSTTEGNKYLAAPPDFLSAFSLSLTDATGTVRFLLNKDVNFIREAYPNPNVLSKPKFYALFGQNSGDTNNLSFILGPTPDADYETELHYFYMPESIVTKGGTWLGEHFDSALLNGCLVEAITFMKGEQDMVALYKDRYQQAITLLKNLGDGKMRQDAYRSGQVRTPVI